MSSHSRQHVYDSATSRNGHVWCWWDDARHDGRWAHEAGYAVGNGRNDAVWKAVLLKDMAGLRGIVYKMA